MYVILLIGFGVKHCEKKDRSCSDRRLGGEPPPDELLARPKVGLLIIARVKSDQSARRVGGGGAYDQLGEFMTPLRV